jgi:hypothetical protein
MIGRIVYAVLGAGALVGWTVMSQTGMATSHTTYKLPQSVRQSPGGYRSFTFWHSGYQGGK